MSQRSGSASRVSRSLSQLSRTSKKSVKHLNASLERIHTFGMATTHKSIYDIEKIDSQYDDQLNKRKINKTISQAKFKKLD